MIKNTRLCLRYLVYVLIVILWTLAEWVTGGQYRVWLVLFGGSLGFGIGLGIETFRTNEEELSIKLISRATLYVVPLAFCDSLLLLMDGYRVNSYMLIWASIYMTASQILLLIFIASTLQRTDGGK